MTVLPPHLRPIRIHSLTDADAACAAAADLGVSLLLVSAPGAAASAGAGWFREVAARAAARHPSVAMTAVLDCADRPGDALGALSAGIGAILFTGRLDVAERLADIAAQRSARLLTTLPEALDLRGARDPRRVCRNWLNGRNEGHVTE
ncbi:hypothetical protein FW320_23105 [Azospirillum sp. Vi22]|uniref:hypothetical protein n=1 Tax=Azospirillum baldaniorum TaxID=1064539 RepID=UPI0011A4634D|nr:hypothetical protein [Azospirillum baldaniorum]NUB09057.1 hypothetical protein [Azospirillum baldaniorum]TWA72047.1 hypothetical protein FBZ84_101319 [Azospirillum baldaniorum]